MHTVMAYNPKNCDFCGKDHRVVPPCKISLSAPRPRSEPVGAPAGLVEKVVDDEAVPFGDIEPDGVPLVPTSGGRMRRKYVPDDGEVRLTLNRDAHKERMKRYRVRRKAREADEAARRLKADEADAALDRLPSDLPEDGDDQIH